MLSASAAAFGYAAMPPCAAAIRLLPLARVRYERIRERDKRLLPLIRQLRTYSMQTRLLAARDVAARFRLMLLRFMPFR